MPTLYDEATTFPFPGAEARMAQYTINALLLEGQHFQAFGVKATNDFRKEYERLRYVVANFNGLIAKVSADSLFGEPLNFQAENNQEWLANFWHNNKLQTQCFESSLSNAGLGDSVFRIRAENEELIAEDVSPTMYFPHLDKLNPRRKPDVEELAWVAVYGKDRYLIRELYSLGFIITRVFKLKPKEGTTVNNEEEIDAEILVDTFNQATGQNLVAFVETNVPDHNLIFHVPNYRLIGSKQFFGTSDFIDTETLQFALNNRLTKVDNVLDTHSDPILAVPPGVLDEDGKVKKESFGMFELTEESGELKPEYIVWNANLESAFKEIDKIVEMLFMTSETSPDVLGMGQGQAESGTALKMRMLRTLAKRNRKKLYYDQAITEMLIVAQKLGATGYKVNGESVSVIDTPTLQWSDGIIDDPIEITELASTQVDAGLKSKLTAMMEINGWTEEEAQAELDRIKGDQADFDPAIANDSAVAE